MLQSSRIRGLVLHTWGWLHTEFIGRLRIEESFKLGVDTGVVVESKRHLSWAHHGSSMFRSRQEHSKNQDSCTNSVHWQTLLIQFWYSVFSVQLLGLSNFLQSKLAGRFVQGRLDGNHIVHLPGPKIQQAHHQGEVSLAPMQLSKRCLHTNQSCKETLYKWQGSGLQIQPLPPKSMKRSASWMPADQSTLKSLDVVSAGSYPTLFNRESTAKQTPFLTSGSVASSFKSKRHRPPDARVITRLPQAKRGPMNFTRKSYA